MISSENVSFIDGSSDALEPADETNIELNQQNSTMDFIIHEDPSEIIESLESDFTRISEDIRIEKEKNEKLKLSYSNTLKVTTNKQKQILNKLKNLLKKDSESESVQEALDLIGNIEPDDNVPQEKPAPQVKELEKKAQQIKSNVEKQQLENKNLKQLIKERRSERDDLKYQLEEINSQIEEEKEKRIQLKEKFKSIAENVKKRDAYWKEKIQNLESQINDQ
ncbi:hypothetical protein GPJ56_010147 [Histomonas meleagridis]|uniref:uncharacterized protein n=1 Tax=Histomonas meleagridis TaxID=135588 RepID=UPI0035594AD9|nr:hypothetical protein GPJ56_010147 [Histomonas meleagridis]KAH0798987.1 hypothetical protein GO595_008222 [Histomonas meleagridis]